MEISKNSFNPLLFDDVGHEFKVIFGIGIPHGAPPGALYAPRNDTEQKKDHNLGTVSVAMLSWSFIKA